MDHYSQLSENCPHCGEHLTLGKKILVGNLGNVGKMHQKGKCRHCGWDGWLQYNTTFKKHWD